MRSKKYFVLMFSWGVLLPGLRHVAQAQWAQVGYGERWIGAMVVKNDTMFAGSNQDIFRSTDEGATWSDIAQLSSLAVSGFLSTGDTLFVATDRLCAGFCDPRPSIFRSTDGGVTWSSVLYAVYGARNICKTSTALYAMADGELFRSHNAGTTWESVGVDTETFGEVEFVFTHGDTIYINTRDGVLRKSTDGGNNWQAVAAGLPGSTIYSMTAFRDTLYLVAAGNGVYRSANYGSSWQTMNSGLDESGGMHTLLAGNSALFVTGSDSVYYWQESVGRWQNVSEGLNPQGFRYIATIAASENYLFAGTDDGIWRRPLSEIITSVGTDEDGFPPSSFVLHQNYPNPFNPTTVISYQLPVRSNVSLKIFNVLGQEVATLVNGEVEAGSHEVQWNARQTDGGQASALPSGVYYYRLQAGDFIETKKLVLLR